MITRWKISNFKSIREPVELPLAPLTILCGPNSSGKSTVIKAILTVSQSLGSSVWAEPLVLNGRFVSLGHFEDILHHGAKYPEMTLEFTVEPVKGERITVSVDIEGRQVNTNRVAGRLIAEVQTCTFVAQWRNGREQRIELGRRDDKLNLERSEREQAPATLRSYLDRGFYDFEVLEPAYADLSPEPMFVEVIAASLSNILPGRLLFRVHPEIRDATHEIRQLISVLQSFTTSGGIRTASTTVDLGHQISKRALRVFRAVAERVPRRQGDESYWLIVREIADAQQLTIDQLIRLVTGDGRTIALRPQEISDLARRLGGALADIQKFVSTGQKGTGGTELEVGLFPAQYAQTVDRVRQQLSSHVFYLGPLRDDPRVIYAIPQLSNRRDVGLKGEYTAAMLEMYGDREEVEYPVPPPLPPERFSGEYEVRRGKLAEAVLVWLQRMGLAEGLQTDETSRVGYRLNVRPEGLERELDLVSVGVGVSQVLPTLVMALLAPRRSTLLIEQPEVHLHPKVQSILGDFFLGMIACGKQCIVETHSEHLINRIRRRIAESHNREILDQMRIYFVERVASVSRFQPVEPNEFGAILEWPKGFFDEVEDESSLIVQAAMEKRQTLRKQRTHSRQE